MPPQVDGDVGVAGGLGGVVAGHHVADAFAGRVDGDVGVATVDGVLRCSAPAHFAQSVGCGVVVRVAEAVVGDAVAVVVHVVADLAVGPMEPVHTLTRFEHASAPFMQAPTQLAKSPPGQLVAHWKVAPTSVRLSSVTPSQSSSTLLQISRLGPGAPAAGQPVGAVAATPPLHVYAAAHAPAVDRPGPLHELPSRPRRPSPRRSRRLRRCTISTDLATVVPVHARARPPRRCKARLAARAGERVLAVGECCPSGSTAGWPRRR